jgi:DNA mismatch repair ATPase MutS
VARLAGLPPAVTERAEAILHELECARVVANGVGPSVALHLQAQDRTPSRAVESASSEPAVRAERAAEPESRAESEAGWSAELVSAVLAIDLATTTPLQALNHLASLQQRARAGRD